MNKILIPQRVFFLLSYFGQVGNTYRLGRIRAVFLSVSGYLPYFFIRGVIQKVKSVIEKHIDTIRDKLKKEIQECIRIQDKHCRPINTKEKDWKNRVKETLKGGKYDWAHVEKAIHKRISLQGELVELHNFCYFYFKKYKNT